MEKIITIDEIVWPVPPRKQAQVIDRNGDKYYMFPDKMAGLKVGDTIKATQIKVGAFQGNNYHTIAAYEKVGGAVGATQGTAINNLPPRPSASPPVMQQQSTDHDRRLDIFVCGAVNALLSNEATGGLYATDRNQLIDLVNGLKYVWKMTLGPNAPKPPVARGESNQQLDDEIPF